MAFTAAEMSRLASRLKGSLILPAEPEYASISKWFIGRFTEQRPNAVVRCAALGDVAEALAFARATGVPFALRSGAHSFAEYSTTDGLLIDLGGLDSIEVDVDRRQVTVGPGTRIGPMAAVLGKSGLVVPFGWCPMVAVAGAAMGGGFGPLGRYYGLACDHLVAAEAILADGRRVRTDATNEPDLFWALRGAGAGSFAAVTALVFRAREAVPATSFAAWWAFERATAVIDAWQHWAPEAPDRINAELVLRASPDPAEPPLLVVFGLMVDTDPDEAQAVIGELVDRVGAAPERVNLLPLSAAELPDHHSFAGEPVVHTVLGGRPADVEPGVRFVKSAFFDHPVPERVIGEVVEWFVRDRVAGQQRELEFIPWGGALGRVAPDESAFVHRSARFLLEHTVQAYGPAMLKRASHRWVTRSKAILQPWANGHVYQNYPDPDLADWGAAYYGDNLPRLRAVKVAYDPTNFFRFEQSIPPGEAVSMT